MQAFFSDFASKFYAAFLFKDRWLQYIEGVGTTLLVTAASLAMGIALGALVAMIRVGHAQQRPGHHNPLLGLINAVCKVYVTVIRGTPMMVQLLIMSRVIFKSSRNFTLVGALTLGINSGAYVSEIIRGGLMAVDPGQMEAGRSLGLNYITTMMEIVVPQAIKSVLPALGNEFVTMIKETSIIQYLGVGDLMYNNGIVVTATYNPLPCYYISAIIYLTLNIVLGKGLDLFERRMKCSDR